MIDVIALRGLFDRRAAAGASDSANSQRAAGRGVPGQLRLLCVVAHPEDATLAFGAVLARYAAQCVETHVITATRGDLAWYGEARDYPGAAALGRVRREESWHAAQRLGAFSVESIDYPDGSLDAIDADEAVARIAREVRRLRPHVVLTFGRDPLFGHPDHNAVSSLCTAAVRAAADPAFRQSAGPPHATSRLYQLAWSGAAIERYQAAFGAPGAVALPGEGALARDPFVTHVDASAHWQAAAAAMACHYSQLSGYEGLRGLPVEEQRRLWQDVALRQVAGCSVAWAPRDDIFQGLGAPAGRTAAA